MDPWNPSFYCLGIGTKLTKVENPVESQKRLKIDKMFTKTKSDAILCSVTNRRHADKRIEFKKQAVCSLHVLVSFLNPFQRGRPELSANE